MRNYEGFEPMKYLLNGKSYECILKDENNNLVVKNGIEYIAGKLRVPKGYELVAVTPNSVLIVIGYMNPELFVAIVAEYCTYDELPESELPWCEVTHKDIIVYNRAKYIKQMVDSRVERKETNMCVWYIRPVGFDGHMYGDTSVRAITDMLDKYGVEWTMVDTVGGSFNLNHDYIEAKDIECGIEYCGAYPVKWDSKDAAGIEYLVNHGILDIRVWVHDENGMLHPNSY